MCVRPTVLAALLAGVLILATAWQSPAEAAECADSLAAKRASALYTEGDSAVALSFAREALRQAKQNCGGQTIAVIPLLADLAALYQNFGRYSEAEKVLRRVINIKRAALDPEEVDSARAALPNMIIDINNLAFVYGAQGKFKEAGILFEWVLEIAEQAVGGNHMLTSQALRNLGGNYRALGKHEEARPLLARAAKIAESQDDEIPDNWADTLNQPGEELPPFEKAGWAETLGLLSEEPL